MRILITLVFITLSANIKAEIISQSVGDTDVIFISGEIEKGDMVKFASLPIEWKRTIVLLNSDGGSAADAITMSAFLATKRAATYVLPDHQCLSECALIWLAGFKKMLSNSSRVGFGDSSYELTNDEKKLIGPMILGESIDPEISGLGFVVVGTLLQKGLGLNFEFIGEFLVPKNNDSRYLNKAAFEKHDIEVLFQDDESGEFRDALKSYGILSDLN